MRSGAKLREPIGMIQIASDLSLPIGAVTETFAILAKRGVGKTYLAAVMTEEMLRAGQVVCVIDPIGVWWGLRAAANGTDPGLPITVIGGDHGDLPLEDSAGELIANIVAEEHVPCVLDLSLLRKGQQIRFMTAFAERLYHRNRDPLHLMVDEADAFAPQRAMADEARLLGAMEDLVRRGRARGIGLTLVTQRAAVLNKNVLTQIECLVCLRTIAPQDRAAIKEWVNVHGTPEQLIELMASLPSLPIGTAWFWSPAAFNLFQRVQVRRRQTFDSSATPKPGTTAVQPKKLAPVDLELLRERMAALVERAKADDPKELRAQIARLKAELAKKPAPEYVIDRRIVNELDDLRRRHTEIGVVLNSIRPAIDRMAQLLREPEVTPAAPPSPVHLSTNGAAPIAKIASTEPPPGRDAGKLPPGEHAILTCVLQYGGANRDTISVNTGYKRSSRDAYLQRLASKGLITINGALVLPTESAVDALGAGYSPLPTGTDLQRYWLDRLPVGEAAVLNALIRQYPASVAVGDLGELVGYKRSSRDAYLQRLAARKLITRSTGSARASAQLFG